MKGLDKAAPRAVRSAAESALVRRMGRSKPLALHAALAPSLIIASLYR